MRPSDSDSIFNKELKVINIGIQTFAQELERQGVKVVSIQWRPPASGDLEMLDLLDRLERKRIRNHQKR